MSTTTLSLRLASLLSATSLLVACASAPQVSQAAPQPQAAISQGVQTIMIAMPAGMMPSAAARFARASRSAVQPSRYIAE